MPSLPYAQKNEVNILSAEKLAALMSFSFLFVFVIETSYFADEKRLGVNVSIEKN